MLTGYGKISLPQRYKYIGVSGEGTAGAVIKIFDSVTEETRAFKILKANSAVDRELFTEEFRTLSQFHHPNLAQVYDFGFLADGSLYFTMEYINGIDAGKLFASLSLSERVTLFSRVCLPIINAIAYVHAAGKIHGDIKSSNILFTSDAEKSIPHIVDFGIAALAGVNTGFSGTLEYAAPEVISGGSLGTQSDIYSLGVLFFEMLTGTLPFSGSMNDILRGHAKMLAPLISSVNKETPKSLDTIVAKMLVKEKERRWSSAREIQQALSEALPGNVDEHVSAHSWIPGRSVGREKEWSQLLEIRTKAPRSTLAVVVTGETGSGKSRMLKEFAVDSMIARAAVIELRLHPQTTVKDVYAILQSQSSHIHSNVADSSASTPQSIEELYIASTDALLRLSSEGLTIIIADNIDIADQSVRSFIEEIILRCKEGANLCFICAERSARKNAEKLTEKQYDEEIRLDGVAQSAVAELMESYFGVVSFSSALAARLHELTAGNIGLIVETLQYLENTKQIVLTRNGWECRAKIETLQIPSDIGKILLESYARTGILSDVDTRSVVTLIALSTVSLDIETISDMLLVHSLKLESELSRLCAMGFLKENIDNGKVKYDFVNPALQHEFIHTMPKESAIACHASIASYWESHGYSAKYFAEHLFKSDNYAAATNALEKAGDMYLSEFSYRNAARLFEQAISSIWKSRGDAKEELTELNLKLANAWGFAGDRAAEGEALQEAVVIASALTTNNVDAALRARCYLTESQYYITTGDFERAARSADKGKAIAEEAGDTVIAARCMAALATSFHRRGDIQEFLKHARAAADLFRKSNLIEDAASVLLDIGFAHALFLNEPELALKEYERAREMFEQAGSLRGSARAVGSIGLAYYWLGKHEESLRSLNAAYALFSQIHDIRGQVNALTNTARVLLVMKKYSQTIETTNEAIALAKKIRDKFTEQKSLETLGSVYERLGLYDRAYEIISRSYALAQSIANRAAEANSLQLMGIIMTLRGEFTPAKELLRHAEEIADELNETDAKIAVHVSYVELYLNQPAPDAENARKHISLAESLAAGGAKKGRETGILLLRTKLALFENNLADARRYISEALRNAGDMQDSEEAVQNVWLYHFKVFERSGDYATAKQSLERAYSLLMESADDIVNNVFRNSYLENVNENKEIVSAYRRINREPLNAIPATNELMLRRLYVVSASLNSILDSNQVLNRLIDSAIEVLRAERGLIFLYDESTEKFHVAVARNVDKSTIDDASKISEGIMRDVFRRGKPVVTMNAGSDDRFRERPSVVNFHLTAVFCVPLILRDKIIGTVYVDSRNISGAMDDNATTIEFLEAFANLAAVAIDNARMHERLRDENVYLRKEVEERYAFENIIGTSPTMKRVYELMRGAIRGDSPVMLEGESGTGKELIARAIHFNGKRKTGKFIAVDCGALPETLLDSELFGHKKGSFTGATEDKTGLFEEANGGTIFLDEITNTASVFQAKLLRVVQEGEIRRVGDTTSRSVNVRIITATNKKLIEEVQQQRFREDLYYRINVIPINIPPLRERRADIPFLAQFFVKRFGESLQSNVKNVSEELMGVFINAEWRGNVRELENTIHRMMVFATDDVLSSKNLPAEFPYSHNNKAFKPEELQRQTGIVHNSFTPNSTLADMLRSHIANVLKTTGGNKTEAAKILQINRTTLIQKMKKLNMM